MTCLGNFPRFGCKALFAGRGYLHVQKACWLCKARCLRRFRMTSRKDTTPTPLHDVAKSGIDAEGILPDDTSITMVCWNGCEKKAVQDACDIGRDCRLMFSIWAKQQTIPSISASDSSKFQFHMCFRSFRLDFLSVFHGEETFFSHFQSYEIAITLSINSLGKPNFFRHFTTVPN